MQEGYIAVDGQRLEFPRLHGAWDEKLVAEAADGTQQLLWRKSPSPKNPSRCACSICCARKPLVTRNRHEQRESAC